MSPPSSRPPHEIPLPSWTLEVDTTTIEAEPETLRVPPRTSMFGELTKGGYTRPRRSEFPGEVGPTLASVLAEAKKT
jgi:hypothetical protein